MTTKRKTQGAEEGNRGEVWDLAKVAQEKAKAARAFLRLLDSPGLPDVLSDNLFKMLSHTAHVCGVPIGSEDPHGGYCAKQVAVLFSVSELQRDGLTFEPARDPSADLAGLISAVLKHPDTPADLYHAMRAELAKLTESDAVNEDPAVIRVALAVHEAEGEGGGE